MKMTLTKLTLFFFLQSTILNSAQALSLDEKLVEENKEISQKIDSLARSLDGLLSNRRAVGKNATSVSLIGFIESHEGNLVDEKGHVDVNLQLPELEEKWRLRFSTYDKEDEFEGLSRNRDGTGPRQQKLGTSLGFVRKMDNIQTLVRPRIELQDPLISSFLFKFSSDIHFEDFIVKWEKKFFAHSTDGVGQALLVDFDFSLNKHLLLRFFNELQYLDRYNLFNTAVGPTLLYQISDRMGISNTFSINSKNRNLPHAFTIGPDFPSPYRAGHYHLESYNLIVSFSHKIYRNVFHYQISPRLDFEKQRGFKGRAGVILRTELIF